VIFLLLAKRTFPSDSLPSPRIVLSQKFTIHRHDCTSDGNCSCPAQVISYTCRSSFQPPVPETSLIDFAQLIPSNTQQKLMYFAALLVHHVRWVGFRDNSDGASKPIRTDDAWKLFYQSAQLSNLYPRKLLAFQSRTSMATGWTIPGLRSPSPKKCRSVSS
jgi:hypothetical protein